MISGHDKISDFPEHFNTLEGKVEQLALNTKGIRNATWVAAVASIVTAMVAISAFAFGYYSEQNKMRSETSQILLSACLSTFDMSLRVISDQFFENQYKDAPAVGVWACVKASENYRQTGRWFFD